MSTLLGKNPSTKPLTSVKQITLLTLIYSYKKQKTGAHFVAPPGSACIHIRALKKISYSLVEQSNIKTTLNPKTNWVQRHAGAGSGGRTRTVSLPLDFESSTSANSIIPAFITGILYHRP